MYGRIEPIKEHFEIVARLLNCKIETAEKILNKLTKNGIPASCAIEKIADYFVNKVIDFELKKDMEISERKNKN